MGSKTKRIKAKMKKDFNRQLEENNRIREKIKNLKHSKGSCTRESIHESKVLDKNTYYKY